MSWLQVCLYMYKEPQPIYWKIFDLTEGLTNKKKFLLECKPWFKSFVRSTRSNELMSSFVGYTDGVNVNSFTYWLSRVP